MREEIKGIKYDYLVIGAGSSGSIVADKLSQDRKIKVAVIEAGPDRSENKDVLRPSAWPTLMGSSLDWKYQTVPQPHLNHRSINWPRGRMVGGSGAMNAMVYIRGHPSDFDNWSESVGSYWSRHNFNRAFEVLESSVPALLNIEKQTDIHPYCSTFLDATNAVGLPLKRHVDLNAQPSIGRYHIMREGEKRSYTGGTVLATALQRDNVTLIPNSFVRKILIDRSAVATGVLINAAGEELELAVEREIILCAGAIGTPEVLLRSGVGAPGELEENGIQVKAACEQVGKNLHDHVQVAVSADLERKTAVSSKSNLGEVGGFINAKTSEKVSALQFAFAPMNGLLDGLQFGQAYTLGVSVSLPFSRGKVYLAPGSNHEPEVKIDPNYLSDVRDLNLLSEGLKCSLELVGNMRLENNRQLKSTEVIDSDESTLREYCRNYAHTQFHPVGTCRAGNDGNSVVDEDFRLRGLENVRVVDASVIPSIPRGNICASTMAIALLASSAITSKPIDG